MGSADPLGFTEVRNHLKLRLPADKGDDMDAAMNGEPFGQNDTCLETLRNEKAKRRSRPISNQENERSA